MLSASRLSSSWRTSPTRSYVSPSETLSKESSFLAALRSSDGVFVMRSCLRNHEVPNGEAATPSAVSRQGHQASYVDTQLPSTFSRSVLRPQVQALKQRTALVAQDSFSSRSRASRVFAMPPMESASFFAAMRSDADMEPDDRGSLTPFVDAV